MFNKILIANRGEIACRVIRTAKKMGIATVAVYSSVDRNAKHVVEADEAICIGEAAASQSYLLIENILQACRDSRAQAVHPGYGFLSENADFAASLAKENLVFIGPGADAIEAMGDKITSKLLATKCGVNVIPGFTGVVKDADHALEIAAEIGYPVMLKASAGGGGKGMRVAFNASECGDGFARATSEAKHSFGDGRIFIEKYIEQPRHIEIQIIADKHGNIVHLNERECSIQRRHQKVIEEAPSAFLDEATRKAMGDQAIALAQAVDYKSAGTVEFIVDRHHDFYFLEMNTRLQVEHAVTEMITGFDLVELMIRVADGEVLPITQADVKMHGWAMESRVYAESPLRDFLPSSGRLRIYREPDTAGDGAINGGEVRVDSGATEGAEISLFYDPMIAKLVTWGETRDQAIAVMRHAVDQYYIRGVDTNLPFIAAIMQHPRFQRADITTNFIAEEYPQGFSPCVPDAPLLDRMIAVVASIHYRNAVTAATIDQQVAGVVCAVAQDWTVINAGESYALSITRQENGRENGRGASYVVERNGTQYMVEDDWKPANPLYQGRVNGCLTALQIDAHQLDYVLVGAGCSLLFKVVTPNTWRLNQYMPLKKAADQSMFLLSPMPGLLVSVGVEVGQKVKAGQELALIEAMKMENSLRAEQGCVIAAILVSSGETVEVDQPIMQFAPHATLTDPAGEIPLALDS